MPLVEDKAAATAAAIDFEPKILAFCCNWCTYAGADLAGLNRMKYPANVRLLRVPCSGRVNPQFVIEALQKGCDGVLVCGCHPGDCHYVTGNYFAKRRMLVFKRLLEYAGLEPERFQVRWISGAEAGKFRDTVTSVCEQIRALGPIRESGFLDTDFDADVINAIEAPAVLSNEEAGTTDCAHDAAPAPEEVAK